MAPTLGPGLDQNKMLSESIKVKRKFKKRYAKEISPVTVSSWFKAAIMLAYEAIRTAELQALKVTGHQVRAMNASWEA